MPALVFLNRKWLIACDDLVIPPAIEALLRMSWLSAALTILLLKLKECNESEIVNYFIYITVGDLFISSMVSVAIFITSSKGSVMEVEKRKFLPTLLSLKLVTTLMDIALASCGTWLLTQRNVTCVILNIFITVTTIGIWLYLFILIFGVIICYDSLGSSKYWNREPNSDSLNFFKKARYIWKLRLKFFCCCADISEDDDFVYVEISSFLASFLKGIDLVPTDILAGIITLSHKHAIERRKHLLNLRRLSKSDKWLNDKTIPHWMTVENAVHYLRIAKSTYGWLAFYNTFRPWHLCSLMPYIKCCGTCCSDKSSARIDNCCLCNFAAVLKITGFSNADIIYSSFENFIHEPAFFIAIDHSKKAVVISISGTRSFSDLVTDIDGGPSYFPSEDDKKFKCHRGVLRSSLNLFKKIENLKLLDSAFHENPTYTLAITGHSLGGSTGAVLGFLLKPKYPDLQCYAYGPMAIISPSGIPESLDFVFSVVVGDDMSARQCGNAFKNLRKEIISSLQECKIPKYRILIAACWYHVKRHFTTKRQRPVLAAYDNIQYENDEENISQDAIKYEKSNLYAPGRILYFEKNNWSKPIWVTGINFQKIIVGPGMLADHQPHKIQFMLEKYAQNIHKTSDVCE